MKNNERDSAETIGGEPYTIPKPSAVPKPNPPKYRPEEINYADDDDIVSKTLSWVRRYYDKFTSQSARDEFEVNCDIADELFRAAADRSALNSSEDDNTKTTGSHVKSSSFYTDLRTISAFEQSVILGNRIELPMVYEPIPKSDEYEENEGQRIAKEQNAILYWAFVDAGMWDRLADLDFYTNKYGNQFIEMDWCYKTETRIKRKPTKWEDRADGVKIPIKFKEEVVENYVVKDSPTLIIHDNKDAWADAMIPDVQDQSCVIFRTQKQLGNLYNMQATGQISNVESIGAAQAYDGENTQSDDMLAERQENAGESGDSSEPNTMIDVWYGYIRIPVKDGKWSEEDNLPVWHKFAFAGNLDGSATGILIQPNRWGESIPVECVHSHKDDKGLYHDGYVQRVKSILAQEMTTIDQATDNWTKRNCAPIIIDEGSKLTRRLEYTDGRNPIYYVKPGSRKPEMLKTDDTTQLAVPMLNMLESKRYEVMGINKTFRGQELGSRTSAGEALTVFDMARKPAYEDIIYKAGQILPFVAHWVKEFTRVYMNPDVRLQINYNGEEYEVAPSSLYGDLKTRLTFVQQFENNLVARKEMNDFFNQRLPIYMKGGVIGKKGLAVLARQDMMAISMKDVDEIIEVKTNYEAIRNAKMENEMIVHHGVYDMPLPEEDHETHYPIHEAYYTQISLLPDDQGVSPENLKILKLHMEQTKQLMEQGEMQMNQTAEMVEGQGQQAPEARTEGEEMGDMMGAQAGVEQNPAALPPEMGG